MPGPLEPGVQELVASLETLGFEVTRDEGHGWPGRVLVLAGAERRVRLLCDRGIWEVGVELDGEFEDVWLIALALDRAPFTRRALSHRERYDLTLRVLRELPNEGGDLSAFRRELERVRREWR